MASPPDLSRALRGGVFALIAAACGGGSDDGGAGNPPPPAATVRQLIAGSRTRDAYAWGAPVHAPFDGEVVRAIDGVREREWIHPVREAARMVRNAATFTPERLPEILGNHVILRMAAGVFGAFVHLAPGSVAVAEGQRVASGDVLGRVGHTGRTRRSDGHHGITRVGDGRVRQQPLDVRLRDGDQIA